jgi:hypothetical protein
VIIIQNNKIQVSSKFKRETGEYEVSATTTLGGSVTVRGSGRAVDASSKKSKRSSAELPPAVSLTKSVGAWFDVDGEFAARVFHADVMSALQLL